MRRASSPKRLWMPATRPLTTLPTWGPVHGFKEAEALANQLDWTIKQDGEYYRRVVASPKPIAVLQLDAAGRCSRTTIQD